MCIDLGARKSKRRRVADEATSDASGLEDRGKGVRRRAMRVRSRTDPHRNLGETILSTTCGTHMSNAEPNFVILPGLLTDEALFRHQIKHLNDIAHCTVADYAAATNIADMAGEVLAQAPKKFVLMGFSMGGYVALEIIRVAPECVLALALVSTSARPESDDARTEREKMMAQAQNNFQIVLDLMMPKFLHPSRMRYHSNVIIVYTMGLRVGAKTFLRHSRAILRRIDSRPYLRDIRCPTLVLCGRDDVLTPVAVHEELAAGIGGAQLRILPESAHFLTIGRPALVSKVLREWITELNLTEQFGGANAAA